MQQSSVFHMGFCYRLTKSINFRFLSFQCHFHIKKHECGTAFPKCVRIKPYSVKYEIFWSQSNKN